MTDQQSPQAVECLPVVCWHYKAGETQHFMSNRLDHYFSINGGETFLKGRALTYRDDAQSIIDALTRERDEAQAVIRKVESLLTNLQPHIEQACHLGRAVFIDNYVDPALELLRAAIAGGDAA